MKRLSVLSCLTAIQFKFRTASKLTHRVTPKKQFAAKTRLVPKLPRHATPKDTLVSHGQVNPVIYTDPPDDDLFSRQRQGHAKFLLPLIAKIDNCHSNSAFYDVECSGRLPQRLLLESPRFVGILRGGLRGVLVRYNYRLVFSISLALMLGLTVGTSVSGAPVSTKSSSPAVLTVKELLQQVMPSMVQLTVLDKDGTPTVQGSGFVVADGVIATNYHVIKGAHAVTANFYNGRSEQVTGLIAMDRADDLVLVKASTSGVRPLKLSDGAPELGDTVYAFGSPLGLTGTVSNGIVSALRIYNGTNVIQTTCPISHGSSGGALVDMTGHVVGVTALALVDGENLNFAYSSSYLKGMLARPFAAVRTWDDEEQLRRQAGVKLLALWHVDSQHNVTFDGIDRLKEILDLDPDLDARDSNDWTPLIYAACSGELDAAKVLLDNGADVNAKVNDGPTVLMIAVAHGQTECALYLLDQGADINVKNPTDGRNALMWASKVGSLDCVKLLIARGAEVNVVNKYGGTALMEASGDGQAACVGLLADNGANLNVQGSDGETALIFASRLGQLDCVRVLLDHGADLHAKMGSGLTALGAALAYNHADVAQALTNAGAAN